MVSFNQFDCIKLDPELFMFFIQGFLEILAWYYIYFFFKYDNSFQRSVPNRECPPGPASPGPGRDWIPGLNSMNPGAGRDPGT